MLNLTQERAVPWRLMSVAPRIQHQLEWESIWLLTWCRWFSTGVLLTLSKQKYFGSDVPIDAARREYNRWLTESSICTLRPILYFNVTSCRLIRGVRIESSQPIRCPRNRREWMDSDDCLVPLTSRTITSHEENYVVLTSSKLHNPWVSSLVKFIARAVKSWPLKPSAAMRIATDYRSRKNLKHIC